MLAGTRPSGSTGLSRRCRGCLPPLPASPGSGCPQLRYASATAQRRGSLTSARYQDRPRPAAGRVDSMRITEVSTPQGLSRNSAMIVVSSNRWVGSSADNALAESFNASLKREILQDRTCWPNTASCRREVSAGWPATTPNDATPDAVIPVRPPTKTTTQPLRCHKRRNHKSRVHHMGSRPDQTCPAMRGQEAPSSPLWSR